MPEPPVKMVKTLESYEADMEIRNAHSDFTDARSVMDAMMLAAGNGTSLDVRAKGIDAEQALNALEMLFNNRFGEEK